MFFKLITKSFLLIHNVCKFFITLRKCLLLFVQVLLFLLGSKGKSEFDKSNLEAKIKDLMTIAKTKDSEIK